MVDFATLRNKSGNNSLEAIANALNDAVATSGRSDDRYWYPSVDKAGNGFAVIRFYPAPANETVPFVKLFDHGFKGPTGQWYIENSLTTLGQPDPLSELNQKMWNSTSDDKSPIRTLVRERKRKLNFISNIHVLQDPANPENEGKDFLYKFGKKIFDKINDAMHPQFADEVALNPFDLWDGAALKLKIRKVKGYRNYDASEWAERGPMFDDDNVAEAHWKTLHSLLAEVAPKKFKTYDELKARLDLVLGTTDRDVGVVKGAELERTAPRAAKAVNPNSSPLPDDDDDADLEFFKKLTT